MYPWNTHLLNFIWEAGLRAVFQNLAKLPHAIDVTIVSVTSGNMSSIEHICVLYHTYTHLPEIINTQQLYHSENGNNIIS